MRGTHYTTFIVKRYNIGFTFLCILTSVLALRLKCTCSFAFRVVRRRAGCSVVSNVAFAGWVDCSNLVKSGLLVGNQHVQAELLKAEFCGNLRGGPSVPR